MSTKPRSKMAKTKPTTQSRSKVNGGTLRRMKKTAKGMFSVCKTEPKVLERALGGENEGLGSGPSTYEHVANRSRRQHLEKYGNSTAKMMADLGKLSDRESEERSKKKPPRNKVAGSLDADSDDDNEWLLSAFRPKSSPVGDEADNEMEQLKFSKKNEKEMEATAESFDRLLDPDSAELTTANHQEKGKVNEKDQDDEDVVVIKETATAEHDNDEIFSVHVSVFSDRKPESLASNESLGRGRAKSRKNKANSGGRPSNGTDAAQLTVNEPDVADILKQELIGSKNLNLNSYEPPPKNMRVIEETDRERDRDRRSSESNSSHKTEKTTDSEEYQALMAAFRQGDI